MASSMSDGTRWASVTRQSRTAGPMAMLNAPSVCVAMSSAIVSSSKVSALTWTGECPAARFTCDSSLVSIQVLSICSSRRISSKPAVNAACAAASVGATAVMSTIVPMRYWARVCVTDVVAGATTAGSEVARCGEVQPGKAKVQARHAAIARGRGTGCIEGRSLPEARFFSNAHRSVLNAPAIMMHS